MAVTLPFALAPGGELLLGLAVFALLCAGAVGALSVHARRLARLLDGPVSTCASAAADPQWRGLLHGRARGPVAPAPLSGDPVAWWRVKVLRPGTDGDTTVADRHSADTLELVDATGAIAVHAAALDAHPGQWSRWACSADPLRDLAAARPRRLAPGEASARRFAAEEFAIPGGAELTVLAVRRPDGSVGPPRRGHRHFFAMGRPDVVAARARTGAGVLLRLAAGTAVAGVALGGLGLLAS